MKTDAGIDILQLTDLTLLTDTCTEADIKALCQKALSGNTHPAAVCVGPQWVKTASNMLKSTVVKVATVLNFPEGGDTEETLLLALQTALHDGTDEIDMVFPRETFFAGKIQAVKKMLQACREASAGKVLKVIMESGAFPDQDTLADAARLVCEANMDFLKTSTGRFAVGATPEAVTTLLHVIQATTPETGIKISGGIRTYADAERYLDLAESLMGKAWISPRHFRIGTSSHL